MRKNGNKLADLPTYYHSWEDFTVSVSENTKLSKNIVLYTIKRK